MTAARRDLLQPSLEPTADRFRGDFYSARSSIMVAFIGGPFAGVLYQALSASKLSRAREARPWLLLSAGAGLAWIASWSWVLLQEPPPTWLPTAASFTPARVVRLLTRGFALILWFIVYSQMRPWYRAAEMHGRVVSPWKPALMCLAAAIGFHLSIGYIVRALAQ